MMLVFLFAVSLLTVTSSLSTENEEIQMLKKRVDILEQQLLHKTEEKVRIRVDNSTDNLEARVEILENDVDNLRANLDVLQEEVIEVQTDLDDMDSSVNQRIEEIEGNLSDITARVNGLEELVNAAWTACESSPCDNGATCLDVNVDTFVCLCRDGYFGATCASNYANTTFLARGPPDITSPVPEPVPFNETLINPGGHYDVATSTYTVPLDGVYEFYIQIYAYPDVSYYIHLNVDGVDYTHTRGSEYGSPSGHVPAMSQVLVHLVAGQQVWVRATYLEAMAGGGPPYPYITSWFSGRLINAD